MNFLRELVRFRHTKALQHACKAIVSATIVTSCMQRSPEDFRAISISVDSMLQAGDTVSAMILGKELITQSKGQSLANNLTTNRLMLELARVNGRAGQYKEAARLYEHLLGQVTANDSLSIDQRISALQEFGLLCLDQGNDVLAINLLDSALTLREQLFGKGHWRYGLGLDAMAMREIRSQNWIAAEEYLLKSAGLYRDAGETADSLLVQNLTNLATVRAELGDDKGEQAAISEVTNLLANVETISPVTRALVLNALSLAFDRKGDFEQGLTNQKLAADLLVAYYGRLHPTSLLTRANLLVSYSSLEMSDLLQTELDQLYVDLRNVTTQSAMVADVCRIAGSFYLNSGDLAKASELLRRAKELYDTFANPLSRDRADCYMALAQLEQKLGNLNNSFDFAEEMLQIAQANFREVFDNLSESKALTYSRQLRDFSDFYLSLLREQPDMQFGQSREFARIIINSKEIVTDGLLTRARILRDLESEEARATLDTLADFRRALDLLYGVTSHNDSANAARLSNTLNNIERLQRRLAELSAIYSEELGTAILSVDDVCSGLPNNCVLVEYYKYAHTDKEDRRQVRFAAVVLNSGGLLANVDLGPAERIDAAARRWVDDLNVPQMLSRERTERLTNTLQTLVWDPVEMFVDSSAIVFISPDAALGAIAFHAFKTSDNHYLIERSAVHYLSSARDMIRYANAELHDMNPVFLSFADPDYSLTRSSAPLSSLPNTRIEVTHISQSWQARYAGSVKSFFGAEASESAFQLYAPSAQTIYIASHGDRGAVNPELEQELLLAGQALFLAGDSAGADGVISAADISSLNLQHVRLVVLSACETAAGVQFDGEGSFSLRRAFQIAGVHSVVSSIWKIDDQSTAQLMSSIFERDKNTISQSLQHAMIKQLAMLRQRQDALGDHPYLWAGVFASGDWRL